ncbi:4-hydroxy-3-methylbut-2-enyl diphosphate reductase [Dirofilaria immitis]
MSSNNVTLNTIIDQVKWIERITGDFIVTVKDHMNKLATQSEKTFGSFEDRFSKGNENLNAIAAATFQKCENFPSLIIYTDNGKNNEGKHWNQYIRCTTLRGRPSHYADSMVGIELEYWVQVFHHSLISCGYALTEHKDEFQCIIAHPWDLILRQ